METSSTTRVLVVAHKTAATPALLEAVQRRAAAGPAAFHLLVPDPHPPGLHPHLTEGEQVLALALPPRRGGGGGLWPPPPPPPAAAAGARGGAPGPPRHDPMDAIEETLHDED